jgi:hypothetical protein
VVKGLICAHLRKSAAKGAVPNVADETSCANSGIRAKANGQEPISPDTLLPTIQLFDLWVLRRFLEIAAPGPNYFVLKHAILEPNGGPMEA